MAHYDQQREAEQNEQTGNVCKFGAQTTQQAKEINWHRLDCLTRHKLNSVQDIQKEPTKG